MRIWILLGAMLLSGEEVAKKAVEKPKDEIPELLSKLQSADSAISAVVEQLKLQAFEIQNLNIRQRDLQLERKAIELRLQGLMCDKGQFLKVEKLVPRCETEKEKGK